MISIIIPTLNEGKYLDRTLMAIKSQKYGGEVEIIVSDSHSDDNTREIARRRGAEIVLAERLGPAVGRNRGAQAAKGEILVFLDADTVPSENLLARISKILEENKDIVGGTCKFLPYNGGLLDWLIYTFTNAAARIMINLRIPQDPGYCFFYRRDIFKKLGGLRETIHGASAWGLVLPKQGYSHRIYPSSPP